MLGAGKALEFLFRDKLLWLALKTHLIIICAMEINAQNLATPDQADCWPLGRPLAIGPITVPNRVFLAPMSGVTDLPFRNLAHAAGAGLVVSEMVASQEYVKGSAESRMRAERGNANIHMVQLAGREAFWMGEAARKLEAEGVDIIDINMGCPAKKVTGGYSGSALMRDLDHAMTLVEATVEAVSVPVTLKMRLGWDDFSINAPELASRAENAGIQMITVHGRTRCQFYTGQADWAAIRAVRDCIKVPLVVNGDINSEEAAEKALELSGADAVMAGRVHLGQPWFAGKLVRKGQMLPPHNLGSYVVEHYEAMLSHYGDFVGPRHARKHLAAYLDLHAAQTSPAVRTLILQAENPPTVVSAIQSAFGKEGMFGGVAA